MDRLFSIRGIVRKTAIILAVAAALLVAEAAYAQFSSNVGGGPSADFASRLPSAAGSATLGSYTTIGRFLGTAAGGPTSATFVDLQINLMRGSWHPMSAWAVRKGPGMELLMPLRVRSIDSLNFERRARFAKLRETTLALAKQIREAEDKSLSQVSFNFRQFMFPFPILDQPAAGYGFFSRTDLVGGGTVSREALLAPFTSEVQQSLGEKRFLDLAQTLLAGRQPPEGIQIDQFYDTQLAALGNYLFNNGRYAAAATVWGVLVQRDPASATACRAHALCLLAQRQMYAAAAELRKSLTMAEGWPDKVKITGSNFQDIFPIARDLADIRAELDAQLAKQPADPDLTFLAAFMDVFQGRWPDAEARLARLAPSDAVAKGLAALLQGGAVAATVRNPVHEALRRAAEQMTGLEEIPLTPEARQHLITVLKSGSATYEDNMRLGDFRFFMGDFTQAGESYRAAHKARPEDPFALFALVHSGFANGEYQLAAQKLAKALALEPGWGLYEFRIQEFYGDEREFERHLKNLQRQIELRPRQAETKFLLAYIYYFSGRYSDATDLLTDVLRLDPNFKQAEYFQRLARLQG